MLYNIGASLDARDDTFDFLNFYQVNDESEVHSDQLRSYESYKLYRSRKLLEKQANESQPALYCQLYRRSNIHLGLYVIFIMVYISIGAICFKTIEEPTVREKIKIMRSKKLDFLANHTCVSEKELTTFIKIVVETSGEGISPTVNYSTQDSVWGFGQAVLFSTTVVTTVGYGNTKPLSILGKLFCIIYAIFGIPLVMMLFTALVDRLAIPSRIFFEWLLSKLENTFGGLQVKLLHCFLLFLGLVIFIFIIPTLIFINIESDWDFLEALYYCYISLTTIGLGDYVPGEQTRGIVKQLYKLCITGYLFVGITFMLLFLRTFGEISEINIGYLFLSPYSDERKVSSSHHQGSDPNNEPFPHESGRNCHSSAADVGNVSRRVSSCVENNPTVVAEKQGTITSDTTRLLTSMPPRQSYNAVI